MNILIILYKVHSFSYYYFGHILINIHIINIGDYVNIIDLYISNLRKDDIILFGEKNGIRLSDHELDFTYNFIKNNYKEVLRNKDSFDFSKYKKEFSEENYLKIEGLIRKYISYL